MQCINCDQEGCNGIACQSQPVRGPEVKAGTVSDLRTKEGTPIPPAPAKHMVSKPRASAPSAQPKSQLLQEFAALAKEVHEGEVEPSELEAVGSFLLRISPELESTLRELAQPKSSRPKKRFKL